ncbi:MAG TPA: phosphatase PAP2 family protein [Thermoanaerobaculia bacterium]|jgi:membrane-associated phospholipid phosphatase
MSRRRLSIAFGLILVVAALSAEVRGDGWGRYAAQIEPTAGTWRTWVISSGKDYRAPAPPGFTDTQAELNTLAGLVSHNDAQTLQRIAFWDAGAPSYRWIDLINARLLAGTPTSPYAHRVYAYVAQAMYDATIATWESKYVYNRRRPSEAMRGLPTALPAPNSPSYPSEHAATAQAAASVLAYFLPAEAASFQSMAEEAGWSRVLAGVQYPSDYTAGLDLGRKVAEQVIAKAKSDGSDAVWTGTVPTGPCKWTGTNPGNVTATGWRPLLLSSASQFRPPAPPACDTAEALAEVAAVKNYARTFVSNYKAFYWQSPEGLNTWVYRYADKFMFEDGLDRNPPRAARVYALIASTMYDSFIASQDGKFTYWYLRPHQLDPSIVPLFAVPNFPSYPSNHSTFSASRSEILAYLFPTRADFVRAVGKEAGDSRIWAGIHYQMDNVAGVQLGKSVAGLFIARAEKDGSLLVPIGTESVSLTGSIDTPADGAVVTGNLTVTGWARVPGSDLGVTVLVDGTPRFAISQSRVARPDVQAAVPSIGDCSTAGYQSTFAFYPGDQGVHELSVVFEGPGGLVRHYPSRKFTWKEGP